MTGIRSGYVRAALRRLWRKHRRRLNPLRWRHRCCCCRCCCLKLLTFQPLSLAPWPSIGLRQGGGDRCGGGFPVRGDGQRATARDPCRSGKAIRLDRHQRSFGRRKRPAIRYESCRFVLLYRLLLTDTSIVRALCVWDAGGLGGVAIDWPPCCSLHQHAGAPLQYLCNTPATPLQHPCNTSCQY